MISFRPIRSKGLFAQTYWGRPWLGTCTASTWMFFRVYFEKIKKMLKILVITPIYSIEEYLKLLPSFNKCRLTSTEQCLSGQPWNYDRTLLLWNDDILVKCLELRVSSSTLIYTMVTRARARGCKITVRKCWITVCYASDGILGIPLLHWSAPASDFDDNFKNSYLRHVA